MNKTPFEKISLIERLDEDYSNRLKILYSKYKSYIDINYPMDMSDLFFEMLNNNIINFLNQNIEIIKTHESFKVESSFKQQDILKMIEIVLINLLTLHELVLYSNFTEMKNTNMKIFRINSMNPFAKVITNDENLMNNFEESIETKKPKILKKKRGRHTYNKNKENTNTIEKEKDNMDIDHESDINNDINTYNYQNINDKTFNEKNKICRKIILTIEPKVKKKEKNHKIIENAKEKIIDKNNEKKENINKISDISQIIEVKEKEKPNYIIKKPVLVDFIDIELLKKNSLKAVNNIPQKYLLDNKEYNLVKSIYPFQLMYDSNKLLKLLLIRGGISPKYCNILREEIHRILNLEKYKFFGDLMYKNGISKDNFDLIKFEKEFIKPSYLMPFCKEYDISIVFEMFSKDKKKDTYLIGEGENNEKMFLLFGADQEAKIDYFDLDLYWEITEEKKDEKHEYYDKLKNLIIIKGANIK